MYYSLAVFILRFLFFDAAFSQTKYNQESWKQASEYLKETVNGSVKECKDFYKHVCSNFGRGPLDNQESTKSVFDSKQKKIAKSLKRAIEGIPPSNSTQGNGTQDFRGALRTLYNGCRTSQQGFPSQIFRRLYNAMGERIGYLPIFGGGGDRPWHLMGTLTRELGSALIVGSVVLQPESKPVLYVVPLSASASDSNFNLTETRLLLTALSTVTGKRVSDQALDDLVESVSAFYDDWDNITDTERVSFELQNSVANLTSGTFSRHENATVDWSDYLNGLLPPDTNKQWLADPSRALVHIMDYPVLTDAARLFKRHSADTIFTYAFLNAMKNALSVNDPSSELSISSGSEEKCIEFAYNYAPSASARVLLEKLKINPIVFRNEILQLAGHVVAAFRYLITSADWMDVEDKMKVNQRLDAIKINPGLPDWIADDDKIFEKVPKFDAAKTIYENEFEFERRQWVDNLKQLVTGVEEVVDEDPEPDFEVNSNYQGKIVNINLGLSLPPQFQEFYPLPLKYGGLGFIIAHELFHAFDPDVVAEESDDEEPREYFLKDKANKEYLRRRSCVIQQYSKNCNKKVNACVTGDASVDNNIADVDGLKVAYTAYKFASQILGGEPPVPEFVGQTGDQMFFIAFARLWCARKKKLAFLESAGTAHAPPKVRVELSVANFPAFAASFRCPVGTRFAPLKRCSLWGDYNAPVSQQSQDKKR